MKDGANNNPLHTHRLMDPICRDAWFDSLAYITFAERVRPRTHIFKVQYQHTTQREKESERGRRRC